MYVEFLSYIKLIMKYLISILLLVPNLLYLQIELSKYFVKSESVFPIVSPNRKSTIYYDKADFEVVEKTVKLFANDVQMVTGVKPNIITSKSEPVDNIIIIGTIGKNQLINELVLSKKLSVDSLKNQWEKFIIKTIEDPFPEVKKALVIVGSDRRGTAYGTFTVSEAIGVSPWYWWADAPVAKHTELAIKNINFISNSPSVKYRGIFINDEDWGIFSWAKKTFDPVFGNIGPKTYEKVFELMLRLRLNLIWPAMHECTTEFELIPENIHLADQYGIVVGSSHCEPMLCNNAKWNEHKRGPWNYSLNRDTIQKYWKENVKSRRNYEAVWTLGIRGIHDRGMQKPPDENLDRINLVQQVFKNQQQLLSNYVTAKWGEVTQCFVPYREVLPLYDAGLKVPEGVITIWTDDNFGYIRRLSTPEERKNLGGSGIYWHLSYYGQPHSYIWINTTAPALMWEEFTKAWENDARKLWVINVGDIKPMEIGIDYFSKMAWNIHQMGPDSQPIFLRSFSEKHFGKTFAEPVSALLSEYYRLGTIRKPEEMNRDWALSLSINRAEQLKRDYKKLLNNEKELAKAIPSEIHDSYFELVGFSARIMGFTGLLFLADRDGLLSGDTIKSNQEVTNLYSYIQKQVDYYNHNIANGKWNYMMPYETYKDLPEWYSLVSWPWGEKSKSIDHSKIQPNRIWRAASSADSVSSLNNVKWAEVDGLGSTGKALVLKPATLSSSWSLGDYSAPSLNYKFKTNGNEEDVLIDFLPTFRICYGYKLRVAFRVDNLPAECIEIPGSNGIEDEIGKIRSKNIVNNCSQVKYRLPKLSKGEHYFRIYAVDPGVVIDKISFK